MEYREIVSVTGIGGLYQLLSTKSDGAIVRNLADNTTKFISARLHNVTPLESIEIYTTGNNVRLHEVLEKMKESSLAKPDTKKGSNDDIKAYFREVYPEMDEDRVYVSDMKKMLKWFELLQANNLLDFSAMKPQEEAATEEQAPESVAPAAEAAAPEEASAEEAKPAKKARAKKAVATEDAAEGEEKPVKKTARKKKAEGEETADAAEKPAKKTAAKKKKEEE